MSIEVLANERAKLIEEITGKLGQILELMMNEKNAEAAVRLERTRVFIARRRREIYEEYIDQNDEEEEE